MKNFSVEVKISLFAGSQKIGDKVIYSTFDSLKDDLILLMSKMEIAKDASQRNSDSPVSVGPLSLSLISVVVNTERIDPNSALFNVIEAMIFNL